MTYEYEVIETGEIIEVSQSIKEPKLTEMIHPKSGKKVSVRRLISSNHVVFRGDNWADKKGL